MSGAINETALVVEEEPAMVLCIKNAPRLDPIRVICQNYQPGCGRIIIQCYWNAWQAYWGAMGPRSVQQFFVKCEPGYLLGKLATGRRTTKSDDEYLIRIIEAVQHALRMALGGAA